MDGKTEIANTEPARLPYLVWGGVRVVTTEVLAKLYETASTNIKSNFNSNKPRFVEGKHFYRLNGQALRDFKSNKVVQSDLVTNKHAKELLLWTQQGAARHAKMLETDKAWEVFEELEDSYFKERQASGSSLWDARLEVERQDAETFAAASQGSHAMHARKAAIPIIRAKRQQLQLAMEPELALLPPPN